MQEMSFLEHLTELRSRLLRALAGFGVAYLGCMLFSQQLWSIVQAPLTDALHQIKAGKVVALTVTESFSVIWMWTPLVFAIFVSAPWIVYQIWAFIAPGLYPRERKWAVPFMLSTAGLFLAGGLFGYYVALRNGLVFLLGIGVPSGVEPTISIDEYFSTFVNVMLGVSVMFELPVVIFFLTLLHLASPSFLLKHARYGIIAIVILAAAITPSTDPFNLTLFAVPMLLLYFLGVFASYLLVLRRENRKFPWKVFLLWLGAVLVVIGLATIYIRS
jgi:sec-independent protein translocase protein TatC